MSIQIRLKYSTCIASILAFLPAAALAQGQAFYQQPVAPTQFQMARTTVQPKEEWAPDLHALKYYAARGMLEEYQKEALRLGVSYPGFQVPADPLNLDQKQDQELWDLFAAGQFDELRATIANWKRTRPYWRPDQKLLEKLELRDRRKKILQAYQISDFAKVKELANASPDLIRSDDPDLVWAVAEALAFEKHVGTSAELFETMLKSYEDENLLNATIQKVSRHLPISDAAQLYKEALGRLPKGVALEPFKISYARGLVIRANAFGFALPVNFEHEIALFGEQAIREDNQSDLQLLAWTSYSSDAYDRSYRYFSKLPDDPENLKAIEGRILALKKIGRKDDARKLADRWKDANSDLSELYVALYADHLLISKPGTLSAAFLQDYADRTKRHKSGAGAEALAWHAFNYKQYETADAWFDQAIGWELTETAAYGKTLVASLTRNKVAFDGLKARYKGQYDKVAKLVYKKQVHRRRKAVGKRFSALDHLSRAHKAGNYQQCLSIADKMIRQGRANSQVYQTQGWCLMKLNRPTEAQVAFEDAVRTSRRNNRDRVAQLSSYGASLAALRQGNTQEAEKYAVQAGLTRAQQLEIERGILGQKAIEAFRQKRYHQCLNFLAQRGRIASEPRHLSELRAWSLYHIGAIKRAHRLFVSLNNVVSTRSVRDGLRVTQHKLRPSTMLN